MMLHRRTAALLPVLAIALFLTLPQTVAAQSGQPAATGVAGTWYGVWVSGEGYLYSAELRLKDGPDGSVRGQIDWTLEGSPRKEDDPKIGLTGIEYVRGTFDPASGVLLMEGYELDDPNTILGLDRYRLFLAENGMVIGGITWNHGTWMGLLQVEAAR